VSEQRSGEDRRGPGRPKGGRRASDPIHNLATHTALHVDVSQLADYWASTSTPSMSTSARVTYPR
jgi:hypothetical protein